MTWSDHHGASVRLAEEARLRVGAGNAIEGRALFRRAAEEEIKALDEIPHEKQRTYGITAASAVALMFKSGALREAKALAESFIRHDAIPKHSLIEIENILHAISHGASLAHVDVEWNALQVAEDAIPSLEPRGGTFPPPRPGAK